MTEFQKWVQPYKTHVNYPPLDCHTPNLPPPCQRWGYEPKRYNPGSLKFYVYDYPFPRRYDKPLMHPGRGWTIYNTTGEYR